MDGEIPSDPPGTPLARFAQKWTHAGDGHTDDRGQFEIDLAAGPARLTLITYGYTSRPVRNIIQVAADGSTVAPDILARKLPKVRGVVTDSNGQPMPKAIVRFRGSILTYAAQPTVSDAEGRFELSLPFIPIDWRTEEPELDQTVIAFDSYEPLAAGAMVRLDESKALDNVTLRMKPQSYESLVMGYPAELTRRARGVIQPEEKKRLAAISLIGKAAPELDGAVWLNTDKPEVSLADFRGKFVLLQFWTTWCGPCHRDMPNVKLIRDLYKDKGLVVIGFHDNSSSLEAIKKDVAEQGLTYPIVVDHPDGRILASYNEHGVSGYPSYVLIGPDGRVVWDDGTVAGPGLRSFKIELIRQYLMSRQPVAHDGGTTHKEKEKL